MVKQSFLPLFLLLALVSCQGTRSHGRFEGCYALLPYVPPGSAKPVKGEFVFVPDRKEPFRYICADQTEIRPQSMWTDGGSVPKVFAWVPVFDRWHYEKAYLIHDWFMTEHRRKKPPPERKVPPVVQTVFAEAMLAEAREKRFSSERCARALIAYFSNHGPGPRAHWNAHQPDPLIKWTRP